MALKCAATVSKNTITYIFHVKMVNARLYNSQCKYLGYITLEVHLGGAHILWKKAKKLLALLLNSQRQKKSREKTQEKEKIV